MNLFKTNMNIFEASVFEYSQNVFGGEYSIPAFQREFVWKKGSNKKKVLELLDSINKGYNIGTIIFWESNLLGISRMRDNLNPTPKNGSYTYILDGQQRTLTLLSLFSHSTVVELELKKINIEYDKKTQNLLFNFSKKDKTNPSMTFLDFKTKILFNTVESLDFERTYLDEGFSSSIVNEFKSKITDFFNSIKINKTIIGNKLLLPKNSMDKAIEQFEKINQSGIKLNYFEILDAVAYTENFKLSDQYKVIEGKVDGIVGPTSFTESSKKIILNSYKLIKNFNDSDKGDISMSQNAIANFEYKDANILQNIIKELRGVETDLSEMSLGSLTQVPYTPNITLFIFFKISHPDLMKEIDNSSFLYKIMFQSGILKRYEKSSSQHLITDIKSVEDSLRRNKSINIIPKGEIFSVTDTLIMNTSYEKIGSTEKAIMLFMTRGNKSLDVLNHSSMKLSNILYKTVNKDRIFPKTKYKTEQSVNSFANICLLSAKTNEMKSAKLPSIFFGNVSFVENENIYDSHLITKVIYDYMLDDNYEKFIYARAKYFAEILDEHMNELKTGRWSYKLKKNNI